MRVRYDGWLGLASALLLLTTSDPVDAQAWLSDRERTEGHGVRVGNFELHPGIGSEVGWENNVFLADDSPEATGILRVSPHLFLSTLGRERLAGNQPVSNQLPPVVAFRGGVTGTLYHYFSAGPATDLNVDETMELTLNEQRPFSVTIFQEFSRTIRPFTEAGSPGGDSQDYDRDKVSAGANLTLSTPGGLLRGELGYRFAYDYFEAESFAGNRSQEHTISLKNSWEFLPKTALFWDADIRLHGYAAGVALGNRNDSTELHSKLGLNGALTPTVALTVAAGYGAGFFADNNDYESVIAQTQLRWRATQNVLWVLGYDRSVNPAFQGNFSRLDRVSTRLQVLVGGALIIAAKGSATFLAYGTDQNLVGARDDLHLMGELSGEYRFVDWLAMTAQVTYLRNITDFVFPATIDPMTGMTDAGPNPAEYDNVEVWFGMRAFL